MEKYAVRNIRLCTKDCICLFVCPTGATDTENSIIDTDKCIGCGACAEACPSGAISLVPLIFPEPLPKAEQVISAMNRLSESKALQEKTALQIAEQAAESGQDGLYRLMTAVSKSVRLVAADVLRESGYLLPQGENTVNLLLDWLWSPPGADFPKETAARLAELFGVNPPADS